MWNMCSTFAVVAYFISKGLIYQAITVTLCYLPVLINVYYSLSLCQPQILLAMILQLLPIHSSKCWVL